MFKLINWMLSKLFPYRLPPKSALTAHGMRKINL